MTSLQMIAGIDAGGSTIRVSIAPLSETGRDNCSKHTLAAAGNLTNLGLERWVEAIVGALQQAIGQGCEELAVVAIGAAGLNPAFKKAATNALQLRLCALGVNPIVGLQSDAEIAFGSATTSASGTVLIAGTGAISVRLPLTEGLIVDGSGPLLGDLGGGYWIGLQAARAVVRVLDGVGRPTTLSAGIRAHFKVYDGTNFRWKIIERVGQASVQSIAGFARTVLLAAEKGDFTAQFICDRAVGHLYDSLMATSPDRNKPIVLAGGLLTNTTLVQRTLTHRLVEDGFNFSLAEHPTDGALRAARAMHQHVTRQLRRTSETSC